MRIIQMHEFFQFGLILFQSYQHMSSAGDENEKATGKRSAQTQGDIGKGIEAAGSSGIAAATKKQRVERPG